MSINIDTQNLEMYPGIIKRVTVDQESVVPYGADGDEKFMLSFSTSAYSDNEERTRIQTLYITDFKAGWCKSSGFAGSSGKFALGADANALEIKIDNTVSGVSDGYYRIELEYDPNGAYIEAEVVAEDMKSKIRALGRNGLDPVDVGFRLAYQNAKVEWKNGRFWIVSGSLSPHYSGENRTSVKVRPSSINDASSVLGFDLATDSETINSKVVREALITSPTVSGVGSVTISQNIGAKAKDCLMITDGNNVDYFQITEDPGSNGLALVYDPDMVDNEYEAHKAKVQLLREQDPHSGPTLYFSSVDDVVRHGVKIMISQIDYSS